LVHVADRLALLALEVDAPAPLNSMLSLLLLGVASLYHAVSSRARKPASLHRAPILTGMITSLVVVVLWQLLVARERSHITTHAMLAADLLDTTVQRQFSAIDRALGRMVMSFSATGRLSEDMWNIRLPRLVQETEGLVGLVWLDSTGAVLQMVPTASGSPTVHRQLQEFIRQRYHTDLAPFTTGRPSEGGNANARRLVALPNAPWGSALLYPISSPALTAVYGRTVIVGVINEAQVIGERARDLRSEFVLAVFRGDSLISGEATPTTLVYTTPLQLGPRSLTVSVFQAPGTSPSHLPQLVFTLGLLVAALLSVTMWQQREMLAEASEEGKRRLQQAIERATDGVWELDVAGGTLHRSPALLRYLGLDAELLDGGLSAWCALIHPGDIAAYERALDTHMVGRADAFECEYRIRAGDGSWHVLIDRGRVGERTAEGRPARLFGISADVTERMLADVQREESERRFRVIFDSANQVQLLLDYDGRILEANRATGALGNSTAAALSGVYFWLAPWWDSDSRTRELVHEHFVQARADHPTIFEIEIHPAPDRTASLEFSLKPIKDHEGRVVQVLVEGRDLSARKRVEETLREIGALTTMGQLAARVAHEINNPLAGIQNAFLLVRGAIPTDHPHYRFVGAIEREIARIAAVTRQLYETYRPDQSLMTPSSVILAVTDAVSFLEQLNRSRQVTITTDLSRAPSLVPVPDALLRQTLYNLIQNAYDASPVDGTITVSALVEQNHCVIRITDEGDGIPPDIRARIFDPFFTTKDKTVKTGGMGIGLSLVRQSVEAVGGSIVVHDQPQGGTEFEVRLPMTPLERGVLR
jgi:PAS domain S-box-containing protein